MWQCYANSNAKTGRYWNWSVELLLITSADLRLPRYIERFRHGRPQSREERQKVDSAVGEKHLPFWWMSPSSLPPSSTPTKTTDKGALSLIANFSKNQIGNVESNPSGKILWWNPFLWKDVVQALKDDHGPAIFSPAGLRRRDRSLSPCRGSLSVSAFMSLLFIGSALVYAQFVWMPAKQSRGVSPYSD